MLQAAARKNGTFSFEFEHFPWGCEYYLKAGRMMPADALETLKGFDAIIMGAVGYPGVPDHISLRELLLEIRHGFDEYVNVRPVKLAPRLSAEWAHDLTGWTWHRNWRTDETIGAKSSFSDAYGVGGHAVSRFPFSAVRRTALEI